MSRVSKQPPATLPFPEPDEDGLSSSATDEFCGCRGGQGRGSECVARDGLIVGVLVIGLCMFCAGAVAALVATRIFGW
jgi:hypothetical protein